MEPIGVVALLAGIVSLRLPIAAGLAVLTFASLLGSAAAVTLPGLANIQPAHLILGFVVLRVLIDPARTKLFDSLSGPSQPGFWLALAVGYGIVSAFFLPRLFAGRFDVYPISGATSFMQLPLVPTNGNITQSIYLIGDLACFVLCSYINRTQAGFRYALSALIAYSVANILFAALDVVTIQTSTTYFLSFIRNATYVIYVDVAVGDTKRIIGSFNEASAFAYATIGIFCFAARLWLGGIYKAITLTIALVSLLLIMLSTSSTGYVAIGPCIALIYLGSMYRLLMAEASSADACFVFAGPCVVLFLIFFVAFDPGLSRWSSDLLDVLIFKKGSSDSGIERSALNLDALRIFFETGGFGTGLGSIRASSFVLACLANLGLLGTALYATFFAVAFRTGPKLRCGYVDHVRAAARFGCLGSLIAATVSGALVDLGLAFYIFAALAAAKPYGEPVRLSRRPFRLVRPDMVMMKTASSMRA